MKNVNLTIRVDDELKKEADKLFSELGLTLSSAINVFFRQAVREQAIPFEISKSDLEIKNRKAKTVDESIKEKIARQTDLYGPFGDVDDFMSNLKK